MDHFLQLRDRLNQLDPKDSEYNALQQEALKCMTIVREEKLDLVDSMEPQSFIAAADYDVLLSDVTHNDLHGQIAERLEVQYLTISNSEDHYTKEAIGVLFGSYLRPMVNLVVSSKRFKRSVNVIFLVDTGSPSLYICEEAMKKLGFKDHVPQTFELLFNGQVHEACMSPQNGHYKDINLIGASFLKATRAMVGIDYNSNSLVLTFK